MMGLLSARGRRWILLILGLGSMSHLLHYYTLLTLTSSHQVAHLGEFGHSSRQEVVTRAADELHSHDTELVMPDQLTAVGRGEEGGNTNLDNSSSPIHGNNTPPIINNWSQSFCPGQRVPRVPAQRSAGWQEVVPGRSFVFSAWYDGRVAAQRRVRVVGAEDVRTDAKPLYCRTWYHSQKDPALVLARADIVPETHNKRFVVFVYSCKIVQADAPYAVSLVRDRCEQANNLLPVSSSQVLAPQRTSFTVCVSPLHSGFDNVNQLTEMIEANRIFGAEKFIFYPYYVGNGTDQYLREYAQDGVVDVINWELPVQMLGDSNPESGIHYYGQLAALNDCLYRNMYKTRYIAFIDLDEIIVPQKHRQWLQLLRSIPVGPEGNGPCSYIFPNVFFRTEWSIDETIKSDTPIWRNQIQSLIYTKRENQIWPHGFRSKYIANAGRLELAGVHFPWKCLASDYNYHVSEKQGLLHHYRAWDGSAQANYTLDKSMHRYKHKLLFHIMSRHEQIQIHNKTNFKGR